LFLRFTPASREALFKRFRGLERESCPFQNLPEIGKGSGMTVAFPQFRPW